MVRIYLDLETYRPLKEDAFVNEKIISCGLLVDETPYCENSLKEKGELLEADESVMGFSTQSTSKLLRNFTK